MSFFSKIKFTSILITLLLILNLVCVYFLVLHHKILSERVPHDVHQGPHRNEGRMGMRDHQPIRFLERELNLSNEQVRLVQKLRQEFMEESHTLRESIHNQRQVIFDLIQEDSATINNNIVEIGKKQEQLEWALFNHFSAIRSICNDEQKQKYDQIIQKVIARFGGMHDRKKRKSKRNSKGKSKRKSRG